MRVKLLVTISGSRDGADWPPRGSEVDLPAAEAADYIAAGYAVAVTVDKAERATAEPVAETADARPTVPTKRVARKS
jgi:hypothetical protein